MNSRLARFCLSCAIPFAVVPSRAAERNIVTLEAYDVQASAFSDFGMSLRTNFEVKSYGPIQWMKVGAIDPDSSAEKLGLARPGRNGRPLLPAPQRRTLTFAHSRPEGFSAPFRHARSEPASGSGEKELTRAGQLRQRSGFLPLLSFLVT
jgi:hypothetical protein